MLPVAGALTEGQTLADSALTDGAASVAGIFAWTDDTVVPLVTSQQSVTFSPTDSTNYESVVFNIMVTVEPAEAPEPPMIEPITFDAESDDFLFKIPELEGYEWEVQGAGLEVDAKGSYGWHDLEKDEDYELVDGEVIINTKDPLFRRMLIRVKFKKEKGD